MPINVDQFEVRSDTQIIQTTMKSFIAISCLLTMMAYAGYATPILDLSYTQVAGVGIGKSSRFPGQG